jgi:hypothetical protein
VLTALGPGPDQAMSEAEVPSGRGVILRERLDLPPDRWEALQEVELEPGQQLTVDR